MLLLFNCSDYIFVPRVAEKNPNTHSQRKIWKRREGRSWEAEKLRTSWVPGKKPSNMSCLAEFWQELLGWQQPVPQALPQSFQPTFATLPRVWDTFHSIHSFSEFLYGQQGFQVVSECNAWMWAASYLECFGSTLFGVVSEHLLGLVVAPRVHWGTMCTCIMTCTPMLCDCLSSWFLWVGLMFFRGWKQQGLDVPSKIKDHNDLKDTEAGKFHGLFHHFATMPHCGRQGWLASLSSPSLLRALLHPA